MSDATTRAPEDEQVYDWADAIERALETKPLGTRWTPSAAARSAKLDYGQASAALQWMAAAGHLDTVGNGSWTNYLLKSERYPYRTAAGLPTCIPPSRQER